MYQVGVAVSAGKAGLEGDKLRSLISAPVPKILPGIDAFWDELHIPIGGLAQQMGWHWVGRLDDPNNVSDFAQVKQSLFSAVSHIMKSVNIAEVEIYVFFISDWEVGELRYGVGTFADLLSYFSLFRDWDEPIFRLESGRIQAGEWTPLLVRLTALD